MAVTINTNHSSLKAQGRLKGTSAMLSQVFERLSSGLRINKASDDAAGLALVSGLEVDRRVYSQALRNINDGVSALNIADAAVGELVNIVTRISELANQAASGALSNTQRRSLDAEAQALSDEFTRIAQSTEFNEIALFNGTLSGGLSLQGGYGSRASILGSLGGALGTGQFSYSSTVAMTAGTQGVVSADMNGDGILDLIAANTNTVTVSLGNGNGTFGASRSFSVLGTNRDLEIGDFNGDGIMDVVVAAYDSGGYVLLGNGDGTLGAASNLATGGLYADNVKVGDLNGDGLQDIAFGGYSGELGVLLGNGDGTFDPMVSYAMTTGFGGLELADFNNDGILDVVAVDTSGTLRVRDGVGDGTFSGPKIQNYASLGFGDVSVGDFNGDGILDLVATGYNGAPEAGAILLGSASGTFTVSQSGIAALKGSSVQVGDINGDGILDFAHTSRYEPSIVVYLGNGDGTFSNTQTVLLGAGETNGLSLGDFNGDGVIDIAGADSSGRIYINHAQTTDGIQSIIEFSLETQADAIQALAPLERKLTSLTVQRGVIGGFQARLGSALNTLAATVENYQTAESRIRDADTASEVASLTRLQILQQSGAAVLAQANQQPALIISLLGGEA